MIISILDLLIKMIFFVKWNLDNHESCNYNVIFELSLSSSSETLWEIVRMNIFRIITKGEKWFDTASPDQGS